MHDLDEFKRFLGPVAGDYTDAQLLQLRAEFRVMAELLLDIYMDRARSGGAPEAPASDFDISGDLILESSKGSAADMSQKQP